jgi:hypothetical protein
MSRLNGQTQCDIGCLMMKQSINTVSHAVFAAGGAPQAEVQIIDSDLSRSLGRIKFTLFTDCTACIP